MNIKFTSCYTRQVVGAWEYDDHLCACVYWSSKVPKYEYSVHSLNDFKLDFRLLFYILCVFFFLAVSIYPRLWCVQFGIEKKNVCELCAMSLTVGFWYRIEWSANMKNEWKRHANNIYNKEKEMSVLDTIYIYDASTTQRTKKKHQSALYSFFFILNTHEAGVSMLTTPDRLLFDLLRKIKSMTVWVCLTFSRFACLYTNIVCWMNLTC